MIDIENVENILYEWVNIVLNDPTIKTIFAHPNAPRPETTYVLINLVSMTPVGIEEVNSDLLLDNSIDINHSNVEELFISINTYYSGALQLASKLKNSLGRITVKEKLYRGGLGYSRATAINDIPEEIDKQWEERAQFDCFFFTRSLDTENIETIQQIEVNNEIDDTNSVIKHPNI